MIQSQTLINQMLSIAKALNHPQLLSYGFGFYGHYDAYQNNNLKQAIQYTKKAIYIAQQKIQLLVFLLWFVLLL